MFTIENTNDTFTAAELAILNEALNRRLALGEDEKTASDAINNGFYVGATVDDLVKAPAK